MHSSMHIYFIYNTNRKSNFNYIIITREKVSTNATLEYCIMVNTYDSVV